MRKARKAVLLVGIIAAFGLITIPASAAQPVAGDTAEQLYANYQGYLVSDMPGNGYGNYASTPHSPEGLYALIDGNTGTWAGAVLPTNNFEFPYHIEMGFGREWLTGECIMDFTGISIGCIQGAWQGITLFDVEVLDMGTGQWKSVLKDVEITWENDNDTYLQKQFDFPETVRSSRLRLVIRDAKIFYNGSYYHFRIDELRMYGTYTGLDVQNLMKFNTSIQEKDINGNKSGGFGSTRIGSLDKLYDDRFDTVSVSQGYGYGNSKESQFPAVLEITLNNKYIITGFDVGAEDWPWHTSDYSRRFVDNVSLYYSVDGGDWQPLVEEYRIDWQQTITRARSGQNDRMPKLAPIYIDEAVIADKIKLVIHLPSRFSAADGFHMTEFVIRGRDLTELRPIICADSESCLMQFQTDRLYSSYLALMDAISEIPSNYPDFKSYYEDEAAKVIDDILENDVYIEIEYDPLANKVAIDGYFFCAENTPVNISLRTVAGDILAANFEVLINANGEFSYLYDTSGLANHKYNVIGEYGNIVKTAQFMVGPPSDENSMLSFSIGKANGVISGRNVKISLPAGSSLTGLVPLFTLSDYATAYINGALVESGVTKINLSSPVTMTVVSDSGLESNYTITAVIDEKPSSGSGTGKPGGGGTVVTVPKITPDINAGNDNSQGSNNTEEKPIFSDIPTGHWAYDAVKLLYNEGIVEGNDDDTFAPDDSLTREQLVKMIVKAFNIPEYEETRFSDVLPGSWYYTYVGGAYKYGVVLGISDDLFGIGQTVKRQDAAVMIYRIIKDKLPGAENTSKFTDDSDISEYAADAVYAMQNAGLINGFDGMFNPLGDITRAEAAKLIASVISY